MELPVLAADIHAAGGHLLHHGPVHDPAQQMPGQYPAVQRLDETPIPQLQHLPDVLLPVVVPQGVYRLQPHVSAALLAPGPVVLHVDVSEAHQLRPLLLGPAQRRLHGQMGLLAAGRHRQQRQLQRLAVLPQQRRVHPMKVGAPRFGVKHHQQRHRLCSRLQHFVQAQGAVLAAAV